MKKFNKMKFNIKKLKPLPEAIELNKCIHTLLDEETGECAVCKNKIKLELPTESDILNASTCIVNSLETMKMIVNSCMSKKEIRAAQKYFDMIPLLNNISSLYEICTEELKTANFDVVIPCEFDHTYIITNEEKKEDTNE